jgi:hypothetical protein
MRNFPGGITTIAGQSAQSRNSLTVDGLPPGATAQAVSVSSNKHAWKATSERMADSGLQIENRKISWAKIERGSRAFF